MGDDTKKTMMGVTAGPPRPTQPQVPAQAQPLDKTLAPTMVPTPEQHAAAATMVPPELAMGSAPGAPPVDPNSTAVLTGPSKSGTTGAPRRATPIPTSYESFVGTEIMGYTIKRKLAEGGMGVVFEGEHAKIGRRAAIKLLKPEYTTSDEVIERFYQEARAVNSIRHENIVDIFDFGRDAEGRAFFVMEFLEGESLSERVKRGPLPWSEAFPILDQTLRALKAAHDKGFVHRDLKPDNIWLKKTDSNKVEVKLLDFGIAKLVGSDSPKEKLTRTGSIMGTPHYMSPEQINGSKDIDLRTDIYAMGIIMYELFSGKVPFAGDTLQAIMTGHLFTEPPRLADIPTDLGVPAPIAEIIDRMLVKDASARYASTADVLSDLRDVNKNRQPTRAETMMRDKPTRNTPTAIPAQSAPQQPAAKSNMKLYVGVAVAAIAVGGGVLALKYKAQQNDKQAASNPAPTQPDPTAPKPTPGPTPPPAPPAPKPIDYDQVRKDAETTLRASIQEAEPRVRVLGSDALGKIKDQPSIQPLAGITEKDADAEVRGHAADALGQIGATATKDLLAKLEKAAPPALQVYYASALAHLGDKDAKKRLLTYAGAKDLAVSFKAALALADVSQPGDKDTIKALRVLAGHEAELNNIAPYAGAVILTKMAALHDPQARKILYSILESKDEGSRLAAAEGLAKLGDDAGKKVLEDVAQSEASPNRLVATVALVPLGDYVGFDVITAKLGDKDPETRRLAARGLGDIGERKSVPALLTLAADKDWTVKIAGASALMAIVGLDPQVLAQASVDWTKSALQSEDWAVRKAAAGVLGDMPEKDAVPLLAAAIADPDPGVRIAASKSAGKMKGADAAVKVAEAAKAEKDPGVKEEQVKALGEIGNPAAHDTLVELENDPGRVGVFAAGSLIAVGDTAGKAKLDKAVTAPQPDIRLAAVQSASGAKNAIVVDTLKTGTADKVFDIRFTAAEGLAGYNAEKAAAVPVLQAGLESKDASVQGRAESALLRLGEKLGANAPTPAEMIDSPDAKVRLAAIPAISALPAGESAPLIRRLVSDSDQEVRRAAVGAIETVVVKDKDAAVKLYKPLVTDADAVVRSKAQGQLSRLVEPPPKAAVADPPPAPPTPAVDDKLPKVKAASDAATTAAANAKTATTDVEAAVKELAAETLKPAKDDAAIKHVEQLATELGAKAKVVDDAASVAETAAKNAETEAGATPSDDAKKLLADAQQAAKDARTAATSAKTVADAMQKKAKDYAKAETTDPQMYVAAADTAIATGNLGEAKRDLDKATAAMQKSGTKAAGIEYSYGQLYDKMARAETDPAKKAKLLGQAKQFYEQFAKSGSGTRVGKAQARAAEIADEIKDLGTP